MSKAWTAVMAMALLTATPAAASESERDLNGNGRLSESPTVDQAAPFGSGASI